MKPEPNKMTEFEINIAIAEACDWTKCDGENGLSPNGIFTILPNYVGDLNAMHEAEASLTQSQKKCYAKILSFDSLSNVNGSTNYDDAFDTLHSTARQRAEAFLRTIGKWKEAKP